MTMYSPADQGFVEPERR